MLFIALVIRITSDGPVLYWSDRVGRFSVIFKMPKFRTMVVETPTVATHLLGDTGYFVSPFGRFLRRTSLDELPQLYSILKRDMTFVGPRPALYNQDDLISLRKCDGVDILLPGITGWAQINGRDSISIVDKVALDVEYMKRKSVWFDIKILWLTFFKVIKLDDISH